MTISQLLLPEFTEEIANTRKIIERVPNDKLGWQPHSKSMSLGRLTGHIAEIPTWLVHAIRKDVLELTPRQMPYIASSAADAIAALDKNAAEARTALESTEDAAFDRIWTLKMGDQVVFSMPRYQVVRRTVFDHLIHHRGQLSVYLRLLDVPIPGMYGPSGDEMQSILEQHE